MYAGSERVEETPLRPDTTSRTEDRAALTELFVAARREPALRQSHLDAFLAKHRAKGVWKLVYDERGEEARSYARALERHHGIRPEPTDPTDGPGFLYDVLMDRQENEWEHRRTRRTRPVFMTPSAYERTFDEFQNYLVDRLYWRARDLCTSPLIAWRTRSRDTARDRTSLRVPCDLTHLIDDRTYRLLSQAHVLLHQVRGGIARGIAHTPTVMAAAGELAGVRLMCVHVREAQHPYVRYLVERTIRECENAPWAPAASAR